MIKPRREGGILVLLGLLIPFQVSDSSRASPAVDDKPLRMEISDIRQDAYGGLVGTPCGRGARPHFYTAKIGNRWSVCTPAGNVFWMNAVYHLEATDPGMDYQSIVLRDVVNSKYASGLTKNPTLNWALQTVRRLRSWAFNTVAEYEVIWVTPTATHPDWGTPDDAIPLKLPFVTLVTPSWYSYTNLNSWAAGAVKDIVEGIKPGVFTGYRSHSPDAWDPNFAQWFTNALVNDSSVHQAFSGHHNEYLLGLTVDDTDYLQGFGAGPDFPTVENGAVSPGYEQPHLGWMVLVTAPTQTSNGRLNVSYANPIVYSKQELSRWLSSRHHGDISALNAAWGSRYTTFGSNGGHGKGTGVLDEDGTCPAKAERQNCWVPSDAVRLAGASPKMRQDLDDFLLHHAREYFLVIKTAIQAKAPGVLYLGPSVLGTYGSPPRKEILQAAADYVDLMVLGTIPPNCPNCTDIQQRIDFVARYGGDKPWANWEGFQAKADSYMFPYSAPSDALKTQADRGRLYEQMMRTLLNARDTATGTYHIVGLKWWELYDNRGEQANWGLLTRRDDPYDGVSATPSPGADPWGYPTGCLKVYGCEVRSFGNFIEAVRSANLSALKSLAAR